MNPKEKIYIYLDIFQHLPSLFFSIMGQFMKFCFFSWYLSTF